MGSERMPGKVLADLAGEPMLARVVERVERVRSLDSIIVATTTSPGDDVLSQLCVLRGWTCYRGSEHDVLDRYYRTATTVAADIIVRVTADCPLIDPDVVERVISEIELDSAIDYVSNTLHPRTFPRGLDTEAIRFSALARAWREDADPGWREHVTPYIYRHPERFQLRGVTHDSDLSRHRWTVDNREDFDLVSRIYQAFGDSRFTWLEALALVSQHEDWTDLNRHVEQVPVPSP